MVKNILAILGVITLVVGVVIYNKNPDFFGDLVSNAQHSSSTSSGVKAPDSSVLLENPSAYLKNAFAHAEKSLQRIKKLESELRLQQKQFTAKARQKEGEIIASRQTIEKAKLAVRAADTKYGVDNPEWRCDWPYRGSTLSRREVANRVVQSKEESDHAQKMLTRYRELDFAFSQKIIIINDKRTELRRAIQKIKHNQEYIDAGNRLREADGLADEMNVSLDMSDVFAEMESLDSLLADMSRAEGINSRKDAVFSQILNED